MMEANDESFGFDLEGIYDTIAGGETFTCPLPDGRLVKVVFEKQGRRTRVHVSFDQRIALRSSGLQTLLQHLIKRAN